MTASGGGVRRLGASSTAACGRRLTAARQGLCAAACGWLLHGAWIWITASRTWLDVGSSAGPDPAVVALDPRGERCWIWCGLHSSGGPARWVPGVSARGRLASGCSGALRSSVVRQSGAWCRCGALASDGLGSVAPTGLCRSARCSVASGQSFRPSGTPRSCCSCPRWVRGDATENPVPSLVSATTASSDVAPFLKAASCKPTTSHYFRTRCLQAKAQIPGSGNGGVFGSRVLLGGVVFGALVWQRSLLVAVGLAGVLARDSDFVLRGLADARAAPVGAASYLLVKVAQFCLPSSQRSTPCSASLEWEGFRLSGSSLFIRFCLVYARS